MVATRESAHLAERLIEHTCAKQGIQPQQLTIHADRGAPMRSTLVALLFSDLCLHVLNRGAFGVRSPVDRL